jgi:hypothetical protein
MKNLPFILEQVSAIAWDGIAEVCRVSYFDSAAREMRTKKVPITEMNRIRPEFERFLSCAFVCSQYSTEPATEIATMIKNWDMLLRGRHSAGYLFTSIQIWDCARLAVFQVGLNEPHHQGVRHCSIRWENGASNKFDQNIIEANYPGVISGGKLICAGGDTATRSAFQVFVEMASLLPYAKMKESVPIALRTLRSCLAAGVTVAELGLLLAESVTAGADGTDLPDLSSSPVW